MPLTLIGAGYGRTGTASAYAALNLLGLRCYHMFEVMRNKANRGHLDFWHGVALSPPGAAHDWDRVFSGYAAALDFPASCVWRELMAAYPDAKVLLTLHPKGAAAWYDSTVETIYFTENRWPFRVIEAVHPRARKFGALSRALFWRRTLDGTMGDRARAIARYERHVAEVKAEVPAERLLVFSADQGWAPLCAFLGAPVPDAPFPNINDRAEMKRMIGRIMLGAYAILAIAAAALAGAVSAVVEWL
jgi:Sulfotransferase domain